VSRAAEILVVGAGPTGLALALAAHDHGAHVRIVERRPETFRPSRALIMHPRTLEVLRPLGVTDALLARADVTPEARLHLGSRVVPVRLAELALPDTAFPHLALLRQTDVEEVLSEALRDRGMEVERGTELVEVCDGVGRARATLRSRAGIEQADWDFVAGCDGQGSTVRDAAGIGWHGGPYGVEVVLADVELDADLAAGVAHVVAGRGGLLFLFALGERATWRLLATRPAGRDRLPFGRTGPPVPPAALQALLDDAGLDARISEVAWSARYPLQHRLAVRFRRGRLFLAGDAAHAWSPAAGQGMNTGIQDAANLGWKLAFALSATDRAALLDSYDRERRPVARRVLALTHLAFWAEAATGRLPSLLRGVVAPLGAPAVPALIRRRRLVAGAARVLAQFWVAYADSPLSVEGQPRLIPGSRVGQRLPDATVTVMGHPARLHALLARPGVHVLLQRDADHLEHLALGPHVTVHRLTSMPGAGLVTVRPDGYVGFRCGLADLPQLHAWLARVGAGEPADRSDPAPRHSEAAARAPLPSAR
jgi:2-polyprenyl-6-methoxyphenol hydroxylase-like FAD-dependent oxidoreductase